MGADQTVYSVKEDEAKKGEEKEEERTRHCQI
jgi:hypothetical protein